MSGLAQHPWRSVGDVLLPVPGEVRRARDLVTEACLRWDIPHLLAPANLVVSELVANAVEHAQTMADLRVAFDYRSLLIEVVDGSTEPPAMPAPSTIVTRCHQPDLSRGLLLVDTTADRWGYRNVEGGKVVWARLSVGRTGFRARADDPLMPSWNSGRP